MKVLKAILFSIAGLLMAGCVGILVCAMNPSLTAMLAEKVEQMQAADGGPASGSDGRGPGQETAGDNSAMPDSLPGINAGWMQDGDQENGNGTGLLGLLGLSGKGNVYEIPENVPDAPSGELAGLSGYQPVQEDGEQIAQEDADNLGDILATGQSGEGLTFDGELYPYYAMLEADMQQLYSQIYANAMERMASFTPVVAVDVDRLKNVFEAVYNDHPELFWMETGYSCKYLRNGACVEITLKFNDLVNDLDTARTDFNQQVERIMAGVAAQGSDLEKERYLHDLLLSYVEYDVAADRNQSAYSALVEGRSVCAGYARAFQYLMQQAGIPCYYCTGFAGQDHAWNIVKLDGGYYNVDVTWDDTESPTYNFFNKTDQELAATHIRTGLSVYLPACMGGSGTNSLADLLQNGQDTSGDGEQGNGTDTDPSATPQLQHPLEWVSRNKIDQEDTAPADQTGQTETSRENLEKAGITQDEVVDTLDDYYADCLARLKQAGSGQQQFSNVVPESLWDAVERAYSSGAYWKGYVEDLLKELKMEDFGIQLKVQRLGGGYLRLYHSVVTY